MATAKDILKQKKVSEIISVLPTATALDAMKKMHAHNIGALMVIDAGGEVQGILSERDFVHKLDVTGCSAADTKVSGIMTSKVLYVEGKQTLEECMALMTEKNIRHLPVYEDGKLLGVVSVRDVLREIISEQKFLISQLEHYIRGGQ